MSALYGFDGLTKDDQWRFSFLISRLVTTLDQALVMYDKGLETEENVAVYGNLVLTMITEPGGRQWWEIVKPYNIDSAVGRYLDNRLRHQTDLPPRVSTFVPWFAIDQPEPTEA